MKNRGMCFRLHLTSSIDETFIRSAISTEILRLSGCSAKHALVEAKLTARKGQIFLILTSNYQTFCCKSNNCTYSFTMPKKSDL